MFFATTAADRRRHQQFDTLQQDVRNVLATPAAGNYLGHAVTGELTKIVDGAFVPNIKDGRVVIPRKHRGDDSLAVLPVSRSELRASVMAAAPLLREPVRRYGDTPLVLPDNLPYVREDEFHAYYRAQQPAQQGPVEQAHAMAITLSRNLPAGIAKPMVVVADTNKAGRVSGIIHELMHVSDSLRQPIYTPDLPFTQEAILRRASLENRGFYAGAAAVHAMNLVPEQPFDDLNISINTMRHYDLHLNPADPFAPTTTNLALHSSIQSRTVNYK